MMGKGKSTAKREGRRRPFPALVEKMADGEEGMSVDHPRSGVTHDLPDSLSHFGLVAMDGAGGANGLVLAETAGICALHRIIKQLTAIGAEIVRPMVTAAVNSDHLADGCRFPVYTPVHGLP
jgi:hypothetical protein